MDRLIEGYRRFRATAWREHRDLFAGLAQGQSPRAMVVGCCDSRVDPQMIFGAAPGELFVVRNVANLVPPYAPDTAYHGTSAALEFGVRALGVEQIVVLGHARCGGIQALIEGVPPVAGDFVAPWIAIAAPAREKALSSPPEDRQRVAEHESIKLSLANLLTFPWIRERVEAGRLALDGGYFDILTGELLRLADDGQFRPA